MSIYQKINELNNSLIDQSGRISNLENATVIGTVVVTSSNLQVTNNFSASYVTGTYFYSYANSSTKPALQITQIGTANALVVSDANNDTTPFVVDASGHVGIGTPTPTQDLSISGSAQISGSLTGSTISGSKILTTTLTASNAKISDGVGSFYLLGSTNNNPLYNALTINGKSQFNGNSYLLGDNYIGSNNTSDLLTITTATASMTTNVLKLAVTDQIKFASNLTLSSSNGTENLYLYASEIDVWALTKFVNGFYLKAQNPLPAGNIGQLAVSGSNLYFHNGTSWKTVTLS